ncbi:MAG: hypothetical protein ACXU95_18715, partial [Isosphaeraceae bacterium]
AVWKKRPFSSFEFNLALSDGDPLEGEAFPILFNSELGLVADHGGLPPRGDPVSMLVHGGL